MNKIKIFHQEVGNSDLLTDKVNKFIIDNNIEVIQIEQNIKTEGDHMMYLTILYKELSK